jgi:hypothetical protein
MGGQIASIMCTKNGDHDSYVRAATGRGADLLAGKWREGVVYGRNQRACNMKVGMVYGPENGEHNTEGVFMRTDVVSMIPTTVVRGGLIRGPKMVNIIGREGRIYRRKTTRLTYERGD